MNAKEKTPKPGDVMQARDIRGAVFLQDSQDVRALCDDIAGELRHLAINPLDVSGAFVVTDRGQFVRVWVTESSAPYLAATWYTCALVDDTLRPGGDA